MDREAAKRARRVYSYAALLCGVTAFLAWYFLNLQNPIATTWPLAISIVLAGIVWVLGPVLAGWILGRRLEPTQRSSRTLFLVALAVGLLWTAARVISQ